jgi:pSer/pThr/pTyr-binding forkhead associated (FHA) protein
MTTTDNDQMSGGVTSETTSMLPKTDLLRDPGAQDMLDLAELPPGSALLVVTRGPNAGSRFHLNKPVSSAGRHPNSDIYLDEVTVSRKHAEFRRESDGIRLVDLGSLNGTYVNRKTVDSALLVSGDEVQLGKFRLIFFATRRIDRGAGETA